jgi:hypothetical protein
MLKTIRAVLITVAVITAALIMSVSQAIAGGQLTDSQAKHEVACYVYAKAAGDEEALKVHANRVMLAKLYEADLSYVLGYHTGVLTAYGSVNTKLYGTYQAAHLAAAVFMYEAISCTTAEAI